MARPERRDGQMDEPCRVEILKEEKYERSKISEFATHPEFAKKITSHAARAQLYRKVQEFSEGYEKHAAVVAKKFEITKELGSVRVNLQPIRDRKHLKIVRNVYDYNEASNGTLIVDYANKYVGGGWRGGGFVQEEQMIAQSTDLTSVLFFQQQQTPTKTAAKRHEHNFRVIRDREAISYEGVHFDAWWPRDICAKKAELETEDVQKCCKGPFSVIAVNAPNLSGGRRYEEAGIEMLAIKTLLIFRVCRRLNSPCIYSGLLGGGAFRGNRPLALAMHAALHNDEVPLHFHIPVFWSFSEETTDNLENSVIDGAERFLDMFRRGDAKKNSGKCNYLQDIVDLLVELPEPIPLSHDDQDLRPCPQDGDSTRETQELGSCTTSVDNTTPTDASRDDSVLRESAPLSTHGEGQASNDSSQVPSTPASGPPDGSTQMAETTAEKKENKLYNQFQ